MCGASEARQNRPSGIVPPSSEYSSCQDAYGPATSATRYVEKISDCAKTLVTAPPAASLVDSTTALDTTVQLAGAVTVSW